MSQDDKTEGESERGFNFRKSEVLQTDPGLLIDFLGGVGDCEGMYIDNSRRCLDILELRVWMQLLLSVLKLDTISADKYSVIRRYIHPI